MDKHQLLGAECSLYTGKVRSYLRYKAIPFIEQAASRDVYQNVIIPRTGVRMIPVLISDDDVAVQDTTEIIDFLEQRYPESSVYPATPLQKLVALLFEVYGDEWLVIPAMHYRWNYDENREFCFSEFGRLSAPELSPDEQYEVGKKVAVPFAGALPRLGIDENTVTGVEQSYLAFLRDFDAHLAEQDFLLGSRPSIGDFGLYGPLYAHLYRDPASGRFMQEKAPRVAAWVERMRDPDPRSGDFHSDDRVPASLEPLLQRMFAEQGPVLSRTIAAVAEWGVDNDGEIPRAIGRVEFEIGGCRGERGIFPFNQWMWQRARDHYHELEGQPREQADALLERVGGLDLVQAPIPVRVERENNRLVKA